MIPKECKRLAEVDFPIAAVSHAVSTQEKKFPPPRGLPSTLHQWWARRPQASSRAILMTLLLPDPCDSKCPLEFKEKAKTLLLEMRQRPTRWNAKIINDEGLREILLEFIGEFSNWTNASNPEYLKASRGLVSAAHPEQAPIVADPFAGGGSIPLEALRLDCESFASDLNPVACLILKVMLESIPRHGIKLADELIKEAEDLKEKIESDISEFFPNEKDGTKPIAYLWARTIKCETPNCGAEIPLMRTMWLCRKDKRKWALRPQVERPINEVPKISFELYEPKSNTEVKTGTISGARATCLSCETVLPQRRVQTQLATQKGGANTVFDQSGNRQGGARLLVVVRTTGKRGGRTYRLPTDSDYEGILHAQKKVAKIIKAWEEQGEIEPCPIPNEPINPVRPSPNARGLSAVTRYGMNTFGDLFTARQQLGMLSAVNHIKEVYEKNERVAELLTVSLGKVVDFNCSLSTWRPTEDIRNVFGRQALPAVWDFIETKLNDSTYVGIERAVNHIAEVIKHTSSGIRKWGTVTQTDATQLPLPTESVDVWFTDPPYYDSIPYADLSDFFLIWQKRALTGHSLLRDPFDPTNGLSPKVQECVWNQSHFYDGKPKDPEFFEKTMTKAFTEGRRVLNENGIASVVFAHQTTEGWEAFLTGIIEGGWTVTASWPIGTESASRINAQETASLATSVHLVCRPRANDAPIGEWANILNELPTRVGEWMHRLQSEGVRGADLVFACVGPALELYSRYRWVETPDGLEVPLPQYLERVWEVVGREALSQVLGTVEAQARNGAAGALEEDARLTALFLWTMQSTETTTKNEEEHEDRASANNQAPQGKSSTFILPFDVARRFAQPLGIHLEDWEGRIIKTEKGLLKLISVTDRTKDLFGASGADTLADEIETKTAASPQMSLFPDAAPTVRGQAQRRSSSSPTSGTTLETHQEATTLDRIHAAMLLQASGKTEALRNLLRAEQDRGPDFLRLANALSALYPRGSEEKRLLDGMLLAVPR